MKSFVRSRRGHGDDEVEVSDDEIFDARGMFEGASDPIPHRGANGSASFDQSEKGDPTATFTSTSTAATSSQGHSDALEDEKIEVSLLQQQYVSEEPQNYEEILRSESRASRPDTPSQGGSCHSYYTALSASSTTPSIESGTTAESSLYLQCDGLRLRPITPELLPNEGCEYIRMASSDSGHEEELLRSPYVDSESYDSRPFTLHKPVLRSLSLSRLNHLTPTVKPKLSVITKLSDPVEPLSPEPTVTIFKKEKPEKVLPPPPPPEPEPEHDNFDEEDDSMTLTTHMTGATSSTAKTYDTYRLTNTATGASQGTMLGSLNNSSFRLSPISATIEHAFKADIRVGKAPVTGRPLIADFQNRKSLVAVPGTPDEYGDDGTFSPPALSPDVTGEHYTFPPLYTPPGAASGGAPLPVVTKFHHIPVPPPLPPKTSFASPAKPESPAIIAIEAAPAPSAYRAPPDSAIPPPVPPKNGSASAAAPGSAGGSTPGVLSKQSSRESLRSAPPKPAPTGSLPPIPVKAQSSPVPAKGPSVNAHPSPASAVPVKAKREVSPKASTPAPSQPQHKESSTAPPKPAEREVTAPVSPPPKPLPQPKVLALLPSPMAKTESPVEPKALPKTAEASPLSPPVKKPRSLPPIPVAAKKTPDTFVAKPEPKARTSPSKLPTPPARKVTVRRPLPPVPKPRDDATEQLLLSPVPKLPASPVSPGVPVNATNALRKITINTAVATQIRMSLASTPVDFSATYPPSPTSPSTPRPDIVVASHGPTCPLFDAYAASSPTEAWTEYPAAPTATGVEADENRVSFYHAI